MHPLRRADTMLRGRPAGTHGFTLIELVVTVTVLGILTTMALPSFRSFLASQRIKTASFDLMSIITIARSEAIKRNTDVTFDTVALQITATVSGVPNTVLQQREPFAGLTLKCISGGAPITCNPAIYDNSGHLKAPLFIPLQISSPSTNNVSCISINLGGRPASKTGNC
jgi:type IV fimbrial biogenesis protein FimT